MQHSSDKPRKQHNAYHLHKTSLSLWLSVTRHRWWCPIRRQYPSLSGRYRQNLTWAFGNCCQWGERFLTGGQRQWWWGFRISFSWPINFWLLYVWFRRHYERCRCLSPWGSLSGDRRECSTWWVRGDRWWVLEICWWQYRRSRWRQEDGHWCLGW